MGFAFEDGTGLPIIVDPANPGGWQPPPPVALQPEPAPAPPVALQPEPAPSPEVAIGDIMVRVQRFADETAEEAQHKARTIIANAQLEAASIVSRARREAEEIAAQSALPVAPEAITNLCSAIEEFAGTNRILVDELVQLRQALVGSYANTPVSSAAEVSVVPPTTQWTPPTDQWNPPTDQQAPPQTGQWAPSAGPWTTPTDR
jgi:hypothetical protein